MTARNIKDLTVSVSTDNGETWSAITIQKTPDVPAESVDEESSTVFGDEYKQRIPTIKDRDLMEVAVRDDGDGVAAGLSVGCLLLWRFKTVYSDRKCVNPSIVTKHKQFTAYIQTRKADDIEVEGNRIAVRVLSLRVVGAITDVEEPPAG